MNADLGALRKLTGAVHTKKVIKGLLELGIPFKMAGGRPVVLTSEIERALGKAPDTARTKDINIAARLARVKGAGNGTQASSQRRVA